MSSYTITNLLAASNMTLSGVTLADGVFTFPASSTRMINQSLPTPIAGHKYYGRVDQRVPAGATFGDGRFEYFGGDGEGKNIVFTSFGAAIMDDQWHTYSAIVSFPSISGSNWTMRSFTVDGSQTAYRRKHLIIDLTAVFGAGNEPGKTWCDNNIPFFEGSTTVERGSGGYFGVNGAAKKISSVYFGVNGSAKKAIAAYYGVDGFAKRIDFDSNVRYQKYTISHTWESYTIGQESWTQVAGDEFDFLTSLPPLTASVSETKPQFNFTGRAREGSLEKGIMERCWACRARDNSWRVDTAASNTHDYFVILSSASTTLWGTVWNLNGYVNGIRSTGDVRGTYIETVFAPAGTYPSDGIQDGFWWVRG